MTERGRPSTFSQDIAKDVCLKLSQGFSLRAICRDDGMPEESTVRQWASDDREGFFAQYTRARDIGLDCVADQVFEIADDKTGDVIRDRLRFDARRWYLSKLAPKRYGDKLALAGDEDNPVRVITQIELVGPDEG